MGANAEGIDPQQKLPFQLGDLGVWVSFAYWAQKRFLSQEHGLLCRAADADADDERRTGVAASLIYSFDYEIDDPLPPLGWSEHGELTHVVAATPFGGNDDLQAVARCYLTMNDSRGIILSIDPGRERLAHYGLAQVPFLIASAHSLLNRSIKVATGDMNLLPYFEEDDCGAAVLTKGHPFLGSDTSIFQYSVQDGAPHRRDLFSPRLAQGV